MRNRLLGWPDLRRLALCFVLGYSLMTGAACGQAVQNKSDQLDTALANVKSGQGSSGDVAVIANAGAVQAIPAIEEQFKRTKNIDTKINIAASLVKLKDQDDTYWDFLLEQATLAVDSDVPDPVFDSQGNARQTPGTQDFQAWAQTHHADVNTALYQAQNELPVRVLALGVAGDPRGIPLLRRALQSPHSMIAIMAAKSLAQMQDKESIPLIIEACRRSAVLADPLAEASLVYFDDSQAQAAVNTYVSPDRAKAYRDARAQGIKPLGN